MAGKTVTIGCRLPHGLIIHHPKDPSKKVELAGMNKAVIIGADHVTTPVDEEFWGAWKAEHKDFAPLVSGAIFEAKSEVEAKAIAKELKGEKTGFEAMPSDEAALSKAGIKPANKDDE